MRNNEVEKRLFFQLLSTIFHCGSRRRKSIFSVRDQKEGPEKYWGFVFLHLSLPVEMLVARYDDVAFWVLGKKFLLIEY